MLQLQQFTWLDFLLAAILLTLLWWSTIGLLFFRKELKGILSRRSKNTTTDDSRSPAVDEELPTPEHRAVSVQDPEDEVMGKARLPGGMEELSVDQFSFADPASKRDKQLGTIPDLLREIREILEIIAREDGTKQDFLDMMTDLKPSYPRLADSDQLPAIRRSIREHAPFQLTNAELDTLLE